MFSHVARPHCWCPAQVRSPVWNCVFGRGRLRTSGAVWLFSKVCLPGSETTLLSNWMSCKIHRPATNSLAWMNLACTAAAIFCCSMRLNQCSRAHFILVTMADWSWAKPIQPHRTQGQLHFNLHLLSSVNMHWNNRIGYQKRHLCRMVCLIYICPSVQGV